MTCLPADCLRGEGTTYLSRGVAGFDGEIHYVSESMRFRFVSDKLRDVEIKTDRVR